MLPLFSSSSTDPNTVSQVEEVEELSHPVGNFKLND
jgi:hypothetical protein